jgi:putative ABC transport system ATP-binding protein
MSSFALQVQNISKIYSNENREIEILKNIHFEIEKGETVSIVGPSGSGKSTLLGLSAGLDNTSAGEIAIMGKTLNKLSEDEKAKLRNDHVGFIFQNFQLIPSLTALDNIMVPLELQGGKNAKSKALDLIERVGLIDRKDHYPNQLSGGEQQRIAIARAFMNNPEVLFADEPTGNLDGKTSDNVESLLFDLNTEKGTTLIIVTHDLDLAEKTNRIIRLKSGEIESDVKKASHE